MAIPQIKNSVQPLDVILTVNEVVDNKGVDQTYNASSSNAQSGTAVAEAIGTLVSNTTTINGKALNEDITLTASDVSALPSDTYIPSVDQTYDASSSNPQSGTAVAEAFEAMIDETYDASSSHAQSGMAVSQAIEAIEIPSVTDEVIQDNTDALSSGGAYTNLVRRLSDVSATGSTTQGVYVDANGHTRLAKRQPRERYPGPLV